MTSRWNSNFNEVNRFISGPPESHGELASPQGSGNPVVNAGGRFIHPYYFLAFSDRSNFTGELADRLTIGHKHLERDRYTGTIRVRLTTKTPLLVCDDTNPREDNGHKTYDMRTDADGKPIIMPSSIRGLLGSVLRGHHELAIRGVPCNLGKAIPSDLDTE